MTDVNELAETVEKLSDRLAEVEEENERLRSDLDDERERREELEDELERAYARFDAKTALTLDSVSEIQSRELEKGAHLLAENVDTEAVSVAEGKLEQITKDDGRSYVRLPGEEDALDRGGAVAHSTVDLLPLQRLSRYDDDMLRSVTNSKPDELAARAWRERDDHGRYALWSTGSGNVRTYLTTSDLAEWIRSKEAGVSKKWSQELARRTLDAMHSLSKSRLGKTKKKRKVDGLSYAEWRVVLHRDTDLPGEVGAPSTTDDPATDEVVGAE